MLQQHRVEASNAMANAMIDVINAHMRTHGEHDPEAWRMVHAAVMTMIQSATDRWEHFAAGIHTGIEDWYRDKRST